jgi:hypothetical protein
MSINVHAPMLKRIERQSAYILKLPPALFIMVMSTGRKYCPSQKTYLVNNITPLAPTAREATRLAMSHRAPGPTISVVAPDSKAIRTVAVTGRLILEAIIDEFHDIQFNLVHGDLIPLSENQSANPQYMQLACSGETLIMARASQGKRQLVEDTALTRHVLATQGDTILDNIALTRHELANQGDTTLGNIVLMRHKLVTQDYTITDIALQSHQQAMQGYTINKTVLLGHQLAIQDRTHAMLALHGNPMAIRGKRITQGVINRHPHTVSNTQVITTWLEGTPFHNRVAHHRLLLLFTKCHREHQLQLGFPLALTSYRHPLTTQRVQTNLLTTAALRLKGISRWTYLRSQAQTWK